jgi:hypothetical protein
MFCFIEGTCLISIFVGLSTYDEGKSRISYARFSLLGAARLVSPEKGKNQ